MEANPLARAAPRSRRLGLLHLDRANARLDRANRVMAVTNDALAAVRKNQIGVRLQKRLEFRLNRLGDQPTRSRTQDFGEWIVDFVFLSEGDNTILGHGVTLLRRFGRFGHQPRYAAFLTPSPSFGHSSAWGGSVCIRPQPKA